MDNLRMAELGNYSRNAGTSIHLFTQPILARNWYNQREDITQQKLVSFPPRRGFNPSLSIYIILFIAGVPGIITLSHFSCPSLYWCFHVPFTSFDVIFCRPRRSFIFIFFQLIITKLEYYFIPFCFEYFIVKNCLMIDIQISTVYRIFIYFYKIP